MSATLTAPWRASTALSGSILKLCLIKNRWLVGWRCCLVWGKPHPSVFWPVPRIIPPGAHAIHPGAGCQLSARFHRSDAGRCQRLKDPPDFSGHCPRWAQGAFLTAASQAVTDVGVLLCRRGGGRRRRPGEAGRDGSTQQQPLPWVCPSRPHGRPGEMSHLEVPGEKPPSPASPAAAGGGQAGQEPSMGRGPLHYRPW